ncbi:MAG: hypothetical protein ACWGP1_07390 [Syntrophobacteria bacterium]|jgi:hypothetical protein
MVKSPPHFKVANLNLNLGSRLESQFKSAPTVHFSNRLELVIIITILKNSATTVKAFLTQKEESFQGTLQLKAITAKKGQKKGGP